ncbi:MAG: hypothetical protein AVO33_06135 [delta proteobacterium ML8_F1]|nr:MAG: hypothetical protein AVO33_06135 [delta proteobacterium ML8_F1]
MQCDSTNIKHWIETLGTFTREDLPGNTRFSCTPEDLAAKTYLIKEMKALDLKVTMDHFGNLIGITEGTDPDALPVMVGSHLDTVREGGRFDGIAGVVSGLEIVRVLKANRKKTRHPVAVIAFAEEEGGRFGSAFLGSRWFTRNLKDEDLAAYVDAGGMTLPEALKVLEGLNPLVERTHQPVYPARAFFELHIEQGPVLENTGTALGLVDTITGSSSFEVTLRGEANHAGTTPMDMRKDAFFGMLPIATELNRLARAQNIHSVGTIGRLRLVPDAYNIIPGEAIFTMDLRSLDTDTLSSMIHHMKAFVETTAREAGLGFSLREKHLEWPVHLDKDHLKILKEAASKRHYSYLQMGSGAGHDAIILSEHCPTSMVFVPSVKGRSHCKEEFTAWEAIEKGCNVLLDTVAAIAQIVE